ncbi:hypothetical protein GCM10020358_18280 [Amorphoplanes nipponensis]
MEWDRGPGKSITGETFAYTCHTPAPAGGAGDLPVGAGARGLLPTHGTRRPSSMINHPFLQRATSAPARTITPGSTRGKLRESVHLIE